MKHLAPLILVAFLPLQDARHDSPGSPAPCCAVVPGAPAPLTGRWTLVWDDTTDLALTARDKSCVVELSEVHGALVGSFDGPVLGRERVAVFTGEALPGTPVHVVTLVQREEGYSCAYQLVREGTDNLVGTWRDSRGGGGTAELTRARAIDDGADVIITSGDR